MQNNHKMSLQEYRTGYTNKFFSTKKDLFNKDLTGLISKLNNLFSVFSENIFIGYNVPIEIVIPGTSNVYKDNVSFMMLDPEENNVLIIEIDNLSGTNFNFYKKKIKNWAHYYTLYSFIADKFDKKVEVVIIDPIENLKIEMAYLKDNHIENLKELSSLTIPIDKNILYKNLLMCEHCNLVGDCK